MHVVTEECLQVWEYRSVHAGMDGIDTAGHYPEEMSINIGFLDSYDSSRTCEYWLCIINTSQECPDRHDVQTYRRFFRKTTPRVTIQRGKLNKSSYASISEAEYRPGPCTYLFSSDVPFVRRVSLRKRTTVVERPSRLDPAVGASTVWFLMCHP